MEFEFDSVNDLQKLCRLCMEAGSELYSIYDLTPLNEVGVHIQFVEMIMGCTSLKIKSDDGLPEAICMQCVNYLGASYNFKQRCEKTDRKLRELISMLKEPKKSNIKEQEESNYNATLPLEQFDIDIKNDIKEEIIGEERRVDIKTLENNPNNLKIRKEKKSLPKLVLNHNEKSLNKELQRSNTENKIQNKFRKKDKKQSILKERKTKSLACTFCLKLFRSEVNLKLHMDNCQIRTTYCGICSKDFSNTNVLKEHLTHAHSIETNENHIYTCDICDSVFSDQNKLLFHYRNHIGVAAYYHDEDDESSMICCHCNKHFTNGFDLENHVNDHKTIETKFICRLCNYETTEDQSVKNHLKTHGLGPLACNICLLSFISNRKFRLHLKVHKPVNKLLYSCLICEEKSSSRSEMKNHIIVHLKQLYSCTSCTKSFQNVSEYESHQMEHSKSVLCTICGKLFPGKSVLDSHMLIHDGIKPFSCTICKQSFRTKHILKGHERVHSDAKPYVCTWCGYSCKRSGDLYIHHRIHTGERPFSCSFPGCNSTFKTSSFMHQHLKRHTGEGKVHTCEVCAKIFSSSIALKRHMLIHNNERPHECDICGKCFRRKHHLKGHKAKIHHQ